MHRVRQRLSLSFLLSLSLGASAHAAAITVKGSDSLVPLARKWAENYAHHHPETRIQISGGGAALGFAALRNRSVDLAATSRRMQPAEMAECFEALGKRPTEYRVGLDGLAVYVNEDNPVRELTMDEVKQIFTGRIKDWSQVGGHKAPITVYGRQPDSGAFEFFKEHVLEPGETVANSQTVSDTGQLVFAVARDKNGIGYGGEAYQPGTRVLKIRTGSGGTGLPPTEENVSKGLYPIARYLYIYVNPANDRGEVAAFLNWIRSEEGQQVVKEEGYFPLPSHLREK